MTVTHAHGSWAYVVHADLKTDYSATARLLASVKPDAMITSPSDNGTIDALLLRSELDTLTDSRLHLLTSNSYQNGR